MKIYNRNTIQYNGGANSSKRSLTSCRSDLGATHRLFSFWAAPHNGVFSPTTSQSDFIEIKTKLGDVKTVSLLPLILSCIITLFVYEVSDIINPYSTLHKRSHIAVSAY